MTMLALDKYVRNFLTACIPIDHKCISFFSPSLEGGTNSSMNQVLNETRIMKLRYFINTYNLSTSNEVQ